jgi:hypothetical protein
MRIRCVFIACAIGSMLQSPAAVQAQYNSASSYGGMPSNGAASGRQGMFGNRSVGANMQSGRGAFGTGNTMGAQGNISSERYVRGNRQASDFVGGSAQDMQHFVGGNPADMNTGNWSPSGGSNASWMSGGGGGYQNSRQNFNRNQSRDGGAAGQNASSIRTTFHADFDYPQPTSNQLSTLLTRRLAQTPAIHTQSPIRVTLQGRTAILQGVASSEHDRSLAEQMVRLEAGIEEVKNEIAVGSPTPTAPMSK